MIILEVPSYCWLYASFDPRRVIGIELDLWIDSFDFRITIFGMTLEGSIGAWE